MLIGTETVRLKGITAGVSEADLAGRADSLVKLHQ